MNGKVASRGGTLDGRVREVKRQAHRVVFQSAGLRWLDQRILRPIGVGALIRSRLDYGEPRWLGRPLLQNLADAWTIQEVIVDRGVDLVLECGTNSGGSAMFTASIFDLLKKGQVLTVDIEDPAGLTHPRIEFLRGSSTAPEVISRIYAVIEERSPKEILVVLDSSHAADHVLAELRAYAPLVKTGGYVIVQDGCVDELPRFRYMRPGPLVAIKRFLSETNDFEVDVERSQRFLFHYSPSGCLRRVAGNVRA